VCDCKDQKLFLYRDGKHSVGDSMSSAQKKPLPPEVSVKMFEEYSRLMQEVTRITFEYILSLQKAGVESIGRMAEAVGVTAKPIEISADIYKAWTEANMKLISAWLEAARKSSEAFFR